MVVVPSFEAGTIVLSSKAESVVLCWKEDEKDRRRGGPPGKWAWRSTRLERKLEGEPWTFSACGGQGPEVPMDAVSGPPTELTQEGKAAFKGTAKRQGAAIQLGFELRDGGGLGISVYRKERRIDVRWRLLGKDGKEIAAGTMNYG